MADERYILSFQSGGLVDNILKKADRDYTRTEIDELIANLKNSVMGGLVTERISEADYAALDPKDSSTIYYVVDENGNIKQYLGDVIINDPLFIAGSTETYTPSEEA